MAYSGRAIRDLEAAGWAITETYHPEGSVADWHEHDAGHFCLVVAGHLVDEGGGRGGERRQCAPGTLLYFPPGVPHRDLFLESGARCLNLRPPDGPGPGSGAPVGPRAGDPGANEGTARVLLCEWRASWLAGRLYDRIRVDGASERPSSRELAGLLDGADLFPSSAPPGSPEWLERARHLIDESWNDDARLGTIAARIGVSRYHLARRFRERFGCSVGQYVHHLRVTRARHLLLHSDASLSEIAFATGFSDQSHFTRIFGRCVGTPPGWYRDAA